MSSAIITANPSAAIAETPVRRFGLLRRWKRLLSAFPSHSRAERLNRLIAQYGTLPLEVRADPGNREAIAMIESVRERARKQLPSWSDICGVERALLSILPADDL